MWFFQFAYVLDSGTVYTQEYQQLPFNINRTDEFGNTLLIVSCQNNNFRMCKYLMSKGANPDHQNCAGHTAAHFAIAFQCYDLSKWLFENGCSDTVMNKFGFTPYDGLRKEGLRPDGVDPDPD